MKNLQEKWYLVKDENQIWGDIKKETLLKAKEIIENTMETWCNFKIQAVKSERNIKRSDYRAGYYKNRAIMTSFGEILLDVPKLRKGGHIKIPGIGKYKRFSPDFELLFFESFFSGVSTRKVKQLTKVLTGHGVSAQKISSMINIIKTKVDNYHHQKITKKYKFLIIDGVWIKVVNLQGKTVKKVILAAIGIDENNNKEIIGFRLSGSEAKTKWNEFLSNLIYRGLEPDLIKCVVSDQHASIIDSVSLLFSDSQHQICTCHVLNNAVKNLKTKYPLKSKGIIRKFQTEVKQIYNTSEKNICIRRFKNFIKKWSVDFENALNPFIKIFEETLYFYDYDSSIHRLLKTSNHIERFFRDFRGRIKNFGSHFKNNNSANNFFYVFVDNFNNNRDLFSEILVNKTE